jgi:hypothetical protein
LLLKQLNKFYNHHSIPWVDLIWSRYYLVKVPHASTEVGSFWWKDVLRLNVLYRGLAKCSLGKGSTVKFWEDLWHDVVLAQMFPRLFSFARNPAISVQQFLEEEDLDSLFALPLSPEAYDEPLQLQDTLHLLEFDPAAEDY